MTAIRANLIAELCRRWRKVLIVKNAILLATLSFVALATISCSRTDANQQQSSGPTVYVPHFTIAVKLSPEAEDRLRSLHESVKVIAYFDGDPLPGQGKYNPPNRDVFLGSDEKIVNENRLAQFDHTRVPLSDWNRLSDKNYFVTINVVSARKVVPNNLLDCADPIDRRIETFKDQTIPVQCWLIAKPDAPNK